MTPSVMDGHIQISNTTGHGMDTKLHVNGQEITNQVTGIHIDIGVDSVVEVEVRTLGRVSFDAEGRVVFSHDIVGLCEHCRLTFDRSEMTHSYVHQIAVLAERNLNMEKTINSLHLEIQSLRRANGDASQSHA